jgi:polyisoprenyl-phosphate glycosyltransferase
VKTISVVTPCYNEESNVEELYNRVKAVLEPLPGYTYEHIFIDNSSSDSTVSVIRAIAAKDKRVKLIVNTRNFGPLRSGLHAFRQATGDAVICLVADLQDPPDLIPEFIRKWEEGYKIVIGVKSETEETFFLSAVRKFYYRMLARLSEVPLINDFTGFGLYDRRVCEIEREVNDPYPYFRGFICELGFERAVIKYRQAVRKRGFSSYNFYRLYDFAMLGLTSHSKVPLRLATFSGFVLSVISMLIAFGYLVYKLLFWSSFQVGTAPVAVGLFFFASVQLFFIGVLGEYIGAVHTQVHKRPLIVEKERVNFDR